MKWIADENHLVPVERIHDPRDPLNGFGGRSSSGLEEDRAVGHTVLDGITTTDGRFTRSVTVTHAAGEDQSRGEVPRPEREGVIEPRPQYGRRPSVVLRGAENDNRIRGRGDIATLPEEHGNKRCKPSEHEEQRDCSRQADRQAWASRVRHCSKVSSAQSLRQTQHR